ncbi:MAG TPA: DUF5703 domain-containing protein [Opitutaceae bacterium]|nr:DUF5703 domain-containing protein [Opitutaceae bacterium]
MKTLVSLVSLSAWSAAALHGGIADPAVIARADLDYTTPAVRSEEGMPVGNGRMGSLVWTTPNALHFQINRVDVFGEDAATVSFPEADSDYASGCAYLDVNVVRAGADVFAGPAFHQHLAVYDGLMTAKGSGLTARVLAWPQRDVMAIEVDDERAAPESVTIDLRMLRYAVQRVTGKNYPLVQEHAVEIHTREQTARSRLLIRDGRIALTQQFSEKAFHDSSAVAVAVVGRPSRAWYLNDSTVELAATPGRGRFVILVSSAATFDRSQDVAARAYTELDAAEALAAGAPVFDRLAAATADWWHAFWNRGSVVLHSADGQADFVAENYDYFLYLMGASSRGKYPPRFGGMLWRTTGDLSRWGSQYWWANTSAYYRNLMPANRLDLMDPLFHFYTSILPSCALAARQQWGSEGIWIPEIVFFDGLERLPDDIAAELRDLMLVRKPYAQRSARFQWFIERRNRHHARWNFQADGHWDEGHLVVPTKGGQRAAGGGRGASDIFGHCTHILADASRIGDLYWQRYQYTMDRTWLRDRAYPVIKGAAEFYRHFPNFRKEADGLYHIHHVNNGESEWNASDTPNEVSAMHLIFPLAIRASEILGVDADLRPVWSEIAAHLVPLPPERRRGGGGGFGAFVYGGPGAVEPLGGEKSLKARFLNFDRTASFIDPMGTGGAQILRNRLRLREGPGAIDAEHLGGLVGGIHQCLLSSAGATEDQDPELELFQGWPKEWDATFTLLARGAFLVTAAQTGGIVGRVEIVSHAGTTCRLRNPWGAATVRLTRDGRPAEERRGEWLVFPTRAGETIRLAPER